MLLTFECSSEKTPVYLQEMVERYMAKAPFPLLRFRMKTEWNVSVFGLVCPLKTIQNGDI